MGATGRVVDATMINDEVDLLRLRLEYLAPHVDHFYVAESSQTYTGIPKPLHVADNQHLFADYWDRMTVVHYSCPAASSAWDREEASRDSLRQALRAERERSSTVLVGDLDEFPSEEQLDQLGGLAAPMSIPVDTYYRRANWRLDAESPLFVTKASPIGMLPDRLTQFRWPELPYEVLGGERGAHLSFMGFTPHQLAKKLAAFSHSEYLFAAAEAERLIKVSDALALDHFGRSRLRGAGLLTVMPQSEWTGIHRWLRERRPEWFATPSRTSDLWRRINAAVIDDAMRAQDLDMLKKIGRLGVLRQPGARRVMRSQVGAARRAVRSRNG